MYAAVKPPGVFALYRRNFSWFSTGRIGKV
jgi:hypothetical protein